MEYFQAQRMAVHFPGTLLHQSRFSLRQYWFSCDIEVFLSGIEYVIGEIKDIRTIDFLRANKKILKCYYEKGLNSFSECRLSTINMALESIRKTLCYIDIPATEIDALLFVAETNHREERISSFEINELLNELGMGKAYPIGISLSDCANILTGIQVAASLVKAGQAINVMVVSTDKASGFCQFP
jgi:3-oxoacyl-[acyl-carrier-protein] synthase-3